MRIGIDCRTMLDRGREGEAAGIGHYTYYLVKNILREDREDEFILFMDKKAGEKMRHDLVGDHPNVHIRHCPFRAFKQYLPFVYGQMVVSAMFERAKLDMLHAPANILPMFYRKRAVVTVHDLAVYDHPEWFQMPYPQALSFAERVVVPYSVEHASRVIAVSEHTKRDLIRLFRLPAGKIDVVYDGADLGENLASDPARDAAVAKKHRLRPGKYVLFLGTLEPRKNVPGAIHGFVSFAGGDYRRREEIDFIIAGRRGWKGEATIEEIARANAELAAAAKVAGCQPRERIRHIGYVTLDEKKRVMAKAAVFVFPSYYEGFGLPVIEAMSLGTPVITSARGALGEVAGDAAVIVEPDDVAGLAAAMKRMIEDKAAADVLRRAGLDRARNFSWRRTAQETVKVYRKAMLSRQKTGSKKGTTRHETAR